MVLNGRLSLKEDERVEWVHLTTVSDQLAAELLVQALRDEDIEALVNAGDTTSFLGVSGNPCRVMVNADHWLRAMTLLDRWERETAQIDQREQNPAQTQTPVEEAESEEA
jgi:hypothetical protein